MSFNNEENKSTDILFSDNNSTRDSLIKNLHEHFLFKNVDQEFLESLVNEMHIRLFNKNDNIIVKGEVGRALFFILKGEVSVISDDGENILNVMGEQSFFGEIGVLFSVPRTATCFASKKSIILTLTKENLKKLLENYPSVAQEIALIAEERFSSFVKSQDAEIKYEFGEELSLGISRDQIKNVPIFRDCEVGFLHMLAMNVQPVQYFQGDLVVKKGDIANEMFFIVRGTAEVFNEVDGTVYAELTTPSFFGEVGLFFEVKRTASVRVSSSVMDVFQLTKNNLDEVLKKYPEVSEKIKAEAQVRFKYNEAREKAKLDNKQEAETEVEIVREKLKVVPLFQQCNTGFLHQLALSMKLYVFEQNKIIIRRGDDANSMFFIISGEVQVESDDGSKVYAEMGQNSFFGEVALFYDIRRTANIRAKTQCTVMELCKDVLDKLLKEYSDIENQLKAMAKENYDLFQKREQEIKIASSKGGEADNSAYNVEATVSYLEKVPLFKKCTKSFFNSLALHTSIVSFQKSDYIIRKGDEANEMYIIINGKVQVVSEDGSKTFDSMKAGQFFGEVGVVNNVPRTATIVAATNVDLIVLSRKSLDEVVKKYPECHKIILLEAEKKYKIVQKRVEKDNKKKNKLSKKESLRKNSKAKSISKDKISKFSLNKLLGSFKRRFNSSNQQNSLKMQLLSGHKNSPYPSFYNLNELTKVTNITQLTCPYFLNILKYLPLKDWYTLRCVCKKWSHIMNNPLFWNEVDFSPLSNQLSHNTIAYALFACNNTTSLTFKSCWKLTNEDILTIVQMCPHLTSLNFSNCWTLNDQGLSNVTFKCTRLKSLNISYCSQIKGFCFNNHQMCNLIKIDISYCKQIGNECLEQLLAKAPELQEIKFKRCNRITDFGIFLVARHCRRIRNIELADCDQITNKCLKWISNNSSNLICLDLTFCKHITNSGIYDLSLGNQEFESLILAHCSCLSDTAILCLHKSISKLKRLSIRGCTKMTDRVAFHVADNCPRLEWIDLSNCPGITISSKNKLLEKLPKLKIIMDSYPKKEKTSDINFGYETNKPENKKIACEVSKEEFYTLMLNKKLATHLINSFSISTKMTPMPDIPMENEFNNIKTFAVNNSKPSGFSLS